MLIIAMVGFMPYDLFTHLIHPYVLSNDIIRVYFILTGKKTIGSKCSLPKKNSAAPGSGSSKACYLHSIISIAQMKL
jgi:hypothetical protein